MKILIDPMLSILAKGLTTEEKAELLMCILEYPHRESGLALWEYMKKQIDIDAQKYREKCDRAAAIRQRKSELKSEMKSELESDLFSSVKKEVSKENINKENSYCNVSESSNVAADVDNAVDNFVISNNFSFDDVCKRKPKFAEFLKLYLPPVVARAEKTIREKRTNQCLSMQQIIDWLQQESVFYQQNHGGK